MPSGMPNHTILTGLISSGTLLIYPVPNLNSSCYGTVTAIEYCYRNQAVFNGTILILEDAENGDFVIKRIYSIDSHNSVSVANCTRNQNVDICCNKTSIEFFNLSMNFAFGVPEYHTGGAALLRVYNTVQEYMVNAVLVNTDGLKLSVGHTIQHGSMVPSGIQMLWFVIGKHA